MSEFIEEDPLSAIQNFDVERIPREAELGTDLRAYTKIMSNGRQFGPG